MTKKRIFVILYGTLRGIGGMRRSFGQLREKQCYFILFFVGKREFNTGAQGKQLGIGEFSGNGRNGESDHRTVIQKRMKLTGQQALCIHNSIRPTYKRAATQFG